MILSEIQIGPFPNWDQNRYHYANLICSIQAYTFSSSWYFKK